MRLPAGVVAWLEDGIDVCDVGGGGDVLVELAQRFPRSRFASYEVSATFDLILALDGAHDLRALRRALRPSGILLCRMPLAALARQAGLSMRLLDDELYAVHA
jgi:hypothetical protein